MLAMYLGQSVCLVGAHDDYLTLYFTDYLTSYFTEGNIFVYYMPSSKIVISVRAFSTPPPRTHTKVKNALNC